MFGGRSIQLLRVFGVRIGVDPSWFLILFLIIWSLSGAYERAFGESEAFLLATVSALLFFVSVVLHELGHAAVAIRNGIAIVGIDLWLFGGVAKMRRDTDSAGVEFKVAVAGPIVTLLIVVVCAAAGLAVAGPDGFGKAIALEPDAGVGALEAVLGYLGFINAMLLVFNLIPGFPLDGGRIARAIAWWRTGDRARATRFAARLGRAFAYALVAGGLVLAVYGSLVAGIWLAVIGLFLGQAARSAEVQSALTARIEGVRVADVMDAEPVSLPAQTKLDRALEEFFLRYRWPWFPVVDAAGRFLGFVSRDRVDAVPEALRPGSTVDEVMTRDEGGAFNVRTDEPLESLLGSDGLRRLGAMMAVDGEGMLRGVVTIDQVRRALRPPTPVV